MARKIPTDELKAFKMRLGWTHRQCAACFGVDHSTWFRWLRGKPTLTIESHLHIAEIIDLSNTKPGLKRLHDWAQYHDESIAAKKNGARFR